MNLSIDLLSVTALWLANLLMVIGVSFACWFAPWKALLGKTERQHAFFAACISLILMMQLQMQWVDGVQLHFLVMSSLVVVFGWSLALIIGLGAQILALGWGGDLSWVLGVNYVLSVLIPASLAYWVFRRIVRNKSNNLFLFLLGGGFFGSILTLLASLLGLVVVLSISEQWRTLMALWDSGLIVVLLSYAEGFLNGLIVTAVTVFFPSIVKTFDEKKYLDQ
ncbi:MAG: energy-coupling factor ABC transporter permease [Pseudomonadales bacterium]|nr:energy-coupling factor ABC transporter permease [Pseudomonadales bacterium]